MELLRPEARLTLVMVIPAYEDPRLDEGGFEGPVITYEQADKDWARTTAQGRSALDRTAAALGPDVEIRLVSDDEPPGAAIVRFAEEMRADVLVIGVAGKSWLHRLLGGSVTDYVTITPPARSS